MSLKGHFHRFLSANPQRLNFCAHSHHPWPDLSFAAQQQAWDDAATLAEQKWAHVFDELIPAAQHHLARLLNLPDPASLCFAGNTHEFLMRLLSGIDGQPYRVLTTDSEFLSFARQLARLEEAGHCVVERVPLEPFDSFPQRFSAAARIGGHHLVYFSQVFYHCGYWLEDLATLVQAVPSPRSLIVIDGYHGFMAVPTDLARIADRAFYLAGGQKYAMAGEGCAFMHCPPQQLPRPLNTGWLADEQPLQPDRNALVGYAGDGRRFRGASFDPTGLYRFNAVMEWVHRDHITPSRLHAQVLDLQREFLEGLEQLRHPLLGRNTLLPRQGLPRGNFLAFRHPEIAGLQQKLVAAQVLTDLRDGCLRIGFGLYHDRSDVLELLRRLRACG